MQNEPRFCDKDKAGKGMEMSAGVRRREAAGASRSAEEGLEQSGHNAVPSQSSASKRFIINCQTAVLISSAPQWKIDLISRHISEPLV